MKPDTRPNHYRVRVGIGLSGHYPVWLVMDSELSGHYLVQLVLDYELSSHYPVQLVSRELTQVTLINL